MLDKKKITRVLFILLIALFFAVNFAYTAAFAEESKLYLGGFPAGFVLNTTDVEVVGLCEVITDNGVVCPARDCDIKAGDVIELVNDRKINSSAELNDALNEKYNKYVITINRDGQKLTVNIDPAVDRATGQKKLGLLVKDSVNGIGTVTYIDKANNKFGSLGHPVTDGANGLIDIRGGCVYGCLIYDVKKGLRGNPGELRGAFENYNMIGTACVNCSCGIFGNISSSFDTSSLIPVQKASISEVKIGKAEIYSTLKGNKAEKYEISIVKVDDTNKDNRNFVIKIDDKTLLELSGGIVQGMSGSPIVQSGKLIGAVTHVFVNDPTRGYGIAIDKMLGSY